MVENTILPGMQEFYLGTYCEISGQPVRSVQHASILIDRLGQEQSEIILL